MYYYIIIKKKKTSLFFKTLPWEINATAYCLLEYVNAKVFFFPGRERERERDRRDFKNQY